MAAYETGLKILKKPNDRSRINKYIQVDYQKVEKLSRRMHEFVGNKDRSEIQMMMEKFSFEDRVIEAFLDSRNTIKKVYRSLM